MRVKIVKQTRLSEPYGPVWTGEVLEVDDHQGGHLVDRGIAEETDDEVTRSAVGEHYAAASQSAARREVERQTLYTAAIHGDVRAARQLDEVDARSAARANEIGTATAVDQAARLRRLAQEPPPEMTTESAPVSEPGGTAGGERTTLTGAGEETGPKAKADREENQAEARAKLAEQPSTRSAGPARVSTGSSARNTLAKR